MRQNGLRWGLSLVLGAGPGALASRAAEACATCDSGDATLTVAGAEQPFSGRLRSALTLRYRTDVVGHAGVDQTDIRELRTDLSTAWAPRDDLFVIADVPLLYHRVQEANLAQTETIGLGDIELRGKWFVFRDRPFAPRWLIAVLGGMKFPTAPWLVDAQGQYLVLEAQPGSGSLDASVGPSLACFLGQFSGYASLLWVEPLTTREPLEPGRSVRGSMAIQGQVTDWFGARLASDLRWEQPSKEGGQTDPDSGGWVVLAGADVLFSPATDVSVGLGARLPVLNRLHGAHAEGPMLHLALIRDW